MQSLGWTEVEVEEKEVEEDSIPLYIVLFNQSRNKVASELIREIIVLMDSQWIGQGNWNRSKKDQMITFGNWRENTRVGNLGLEYFMTKTETLQESM